MVEAIQLDKLMAPDRLIASAKITVQGLDCPDCATKVEKAVKQMPGMTAARISFPSGRFDLTFDTSQTGVEQVIDKIRLLGYDARKETSKDALEHVINSDIRVVGLDCADCAAKLEKRIASIPGVEKAVVNFGAAKINVAHRGSVEEILEVIKNLGYVGKLKEDCIAKETTDSLWENNQYAMPSLFSLIMLIVGFSAKLAGTPELAVNILFTFGIIMGGYLPARNGLLMLLNAHELDMNFLMIIAVIGAVAIGQFEEAAVVVFLFAFGNALQGYTLDKTRNSIRALMELAPNKALIKRDGMTSLLPIEKIRIGDIMLVRPGERIPMDGKVITGFSSVNQAPITGESIPIDKHSGDMVYAGTINERGSLDVEITKPAKDNTLARVIAMVEEAQAQKAPSQQFIDQFSKYYTPLVIGAAVLVAVVPSLLFAQPFHKWFYEALGMLLVACPCALVISTPVAIVSAIGSAAKSGVLIKGGMYLEETGSLSAVAFDKTGTLTKGKPKVTDIIPINGHSEDVLLTIAATIESRSEHPLSEAIMQAARDKNISFPSVDKFISVPGKGAAGEINGILYQIGNRKMFVENIIPVVAEEHACRLQNEGKTVMFLKDQENILGLIAVADVLRENSRQAVDTIKKKGIKNIIMLTGDNEPTARAIASQAGIDEWKADLLPADKVNAIKELRNQYGKVAMIGDGVNDAPAMAISTVGIAMGVAGTDAALETADIALMSDDLTRLSYTIQLSRKTIAIIKQNIAFALLLKGLILLLVIPGWLTLWLAVVGDMGASLLVTLNGMRLLHAKYRP